AEEAAWRVDEAVARIDDIDVVKRPDDKADTRAADPLSEAHRLWLELPLLDPEWIEHLGMLDRSDVERAPGRIRRDQRPPVGPLCGPAAAAAVERLMAQKPPSAGSTPEIIGTFDQC